ncbi:Uncharacterized protein AB751O23_AN_00100 [Chlamydiales bacterium SCGC AB-751-O23]|jgi:predicted RNA-binding protein with PIN domain|nr:Uncharacterized protein AB751O23_AN_00100 [Chlamydiales bacterium SCGC AB-751-O23]
MKFLIDAYNLFFYLNKQDLSKQNFLDEKDRFIERFDQISKESSHSFILVFDGGEEKTFIKKHFGRVELVYAPPGQTADNCILVLLDEGLQKKVCVITNDQEVVRRTKARLTKTMSCYNFLNLLSYNESEETTNPSYKKAGEHYLHNYYLEAFQKRMNDKQEEE